MKITNISSQQKNSNRVNVFVDGAYRLSLDIYQVIDLGIRIGNEYSEDELLSIETESQFGKVYGRALEYCLSRPHSAKEVRDYLWKKTRTIKRMVKLTEKQRNRGIHQPKIIEKPGVPQDVVDRVFDRLVEKGYIDDEAFTKFWVENRHRTKGASRRKLENELRSKGVENTIIMDALNNTTRNDSHELTKMIAKKYTKYDDQKLVAYLARQGFSYDDIKNAIVEYKDSIDS